MNFSRALALFLSGVIVAFILCVLVPAETTAKESNLWVTTTKGGAVIVNTNSNGTCYFYNLSSQPVSFLAKGIAESCLHNIPANYSLAIHLIDGQQTGLFNDPYDYIGAVFTIAINDATSLIWLNQQIREVFFAASEQLKGHQYQTRTDFERKNPNRTYVQFSPN